MMILYYMFSITMFFLPPVVALGHWLPHWATIIATVLHATTCGKYPYSDYVTGLLYVIGCFFVIHDFPLWFSVLYYISFVAFLIQVFITYKRK